MFMTTLIAAKKLLMRYPPRLELVPHNIAVGELAYLLAKIINKKNVGIHIDPQFVRVCGYLHNIGKRKKGDFSRKTEIAILGKRGLPRVAETIKSIGFAIKKYPPVTTEQKLLFYADSHIHGTRAVSWEEKLKYIKEKEGNKRLQVLDLANNVMKEIDGLLGNHKNELFPEKHIPSKQPSTVEWYIKRAEELGAKKINIVKEIEKATSKKIKPGKVIEKNLITHHHNFDIILEQIAAGMPFNVIGGYSLTKKEGVGYETLTLGHVTNIEAIKYFQKNYKAKAFVSIADLDGVLAKNVDLEEKKGTYDSFIKHFLSLGLDQKKTNFILESQNSFNCLKNSFWISKFIEDSDFDEHYAGEQKKRFRQKNGLIVALGDMFTPYFLNYLPVLVVMGIDEARHIAFENRIHNIIKKEYPGMPPLAAIYTLTLNSLNKIKMSKRNEKTAIYLAEPPNESFKKITSFECEEYGNPENCCPYQYSVVCDVPNAFLKSVYIGCKNRSRDCKKCKIILAKKIKEWLENHQKRLKKINYKF